MGGERIIGDGLSSDKVFLYYSLQHFRCAGVVPDALRINQSDWTGLAYPEAICLCPVYSAAFSQSEFGEATLQEFPRFQTGVQVAAFRFTLIATKKNVAPCFIGTETCGNIAQRG